jgi:hypothetical protein
MLAESMLTHSCCLSGGELYFSDVYSTQRVPQELRQDPILWGECLSGALYWNDFLRLARECGFADPRLVSSTPVVINNAELEERIARCMPSPTGGALFHSATYRLFKIPELEPDAENYGQAVCYLGTIPYPTVPVTSTATEETSTAAEQPVPWTTLHSVTSPPSESASPAKCAKVASCCPATTAQGRTSTCCPTEKVGPDSCATPDHAHSETSPSMAQDAQGGCKQTGDQAKAASHQDATGNGRNRVRIDDSAVAGDTTTSGASPNKRTTEAQQGTAQGPKLQATFVLDTNHRFPAGMVIPVSGNTYRMLRQTRFRSHFQFFGGEFTQHYGILEGRGSTRAVPFAERIAGSGVRSNNNYGGAVNGVVGSGGCVEGNEDADEHTACC